MSTTDRDRQAAGRQVAYAFSLPPSRPSPSISEARQAGKILVRACRALGDDLRLHVGYEAIAAGLGFRSWSDLTQELGWRPAAWTEGRRRARMLELVPDVAADVLDGALATLDARLVDRRWR